MRPPIWVVFRRLGLGGVEGVEVRCCVRRADLGGGEGVDLGGDSSPNSVVVRPATWVVVERRRAGWW